MTLSRYADDIVELLTRAVGVVDEHGNLHAPKGLGKLSGRFVSKGDAGEIRILGPQGAYDSDVYWRALPSSLAPGIVRGDDPHDAVRQVRASTEEWGGLGRWWWASGDIDDTGFYGGTDGSVLVGARFRSGALSFSEPAGHSGQFADEPMDMAVVAVRVWEDGQWRPIPVPLGLIAATHDVD